MEEKHDPVDSIEWTFVTLTSSTQLSSKVLPQELLCLMTLIVSELIIKSIKCKKYNYEKA